jgi:hypothetical protein
MSNVISDRMTAVREDGIVVFLIGMRINRWWKIHRWLPVVLAMPRMLRELAGRPDAGLLGAIYVNMPPFGLGKFARLETAGGRRARAAERLGARVA